jgi:hypothetical protein
MSAFGGKADILISVLEYAAQPKFLGAGRRRDDLPHFRARSDERKFCGISPAGNGLDCGDRNHRQHDEAARRAHGPPSCKLAPNAKLKSALFLRASWVGQATSVGSVRQRACGPGKNSGGGRGLGTDICRDQTQPLPQMDSDVCYRSCHRTHTL